MNRCLEVDIVDSNSESPLLLVILYVSVHYKYIDTRNLLRKCHVRTLCNIVVHLEIHVS